MERFYALYDRSASPTETLETLKADLRARAGALPVASGGSVTFICHRLPYGFAFSEVPSTHLFSYPDLGISIIHGFAAEQPGSRGVQVATLVNPDTTPAPEIVAVTKSWESVARSFACTKVRTGGVKTITEMIELFPYNLLVLATHCGDVPGERWTYQFTDSEGIDRTLVVDIAVGFGVGGNTDKVQVTQFSRFVSLDGIPWDDDGRKAQHYVGKRSSITWSGRATWTSSNPPSEN